MNEEGGKGIFPKPARSSQYAVRVNSGWGSLWKKRAPLLGHLDMELTERCNNRCRHCFISRPADDMEAYQRELTTFEIKGILSEAARLGALSVRFTGGEPLLRDDFPEIYMFSRRLGLRVTLFTNGRLITRKLADLFARIPPLEKIEVSVYGTTRQTYEAVTRAADAYGPFRRGVQLLWERKIPFLLKGTLLACNKNEILDSESWEGCFPGFLERPLAYTLFLSLRGRRDSEGENREIRKMRLSGEEITRILTRQGVSYWKERERFCSHFLGPPGDRLFPCGAGAGSGSVDAYGKFQLCLMLRQPDTVYDLRTGTLREALMKFSPRIREWRAQDSEYLSRCGRCFLKALCEQCPAYSWAEHGFLDRPVEYLCRVAHAEARYLGLLKEGEEAWQVKNWKARKIFAPARKEELLNRCKENVFAPKIASL
jgi:radical SAM protein with 4Fe4S-binding SPASM domain